MSYLNVRANSGILIQLSRNYFKIIHEDPVHYSFDHLVLYDKSCIKKWQLGLKIFELYIYKGDFYLFEFDFFQLNKDFLKRINKEGDTSWADQVPTVIGE